MDLAFAVAPVMEWRSGGGTLGAGFYVLKPRLDVLGRPSSLPSSLVPGWARVLISSTTKLPSPPLLLNSRRCVAIISLLSPYLPFFLLPIAAQAQINGTVEQKQRPARRGAVREEALLLRRGRNNGGRRGFGGKGGPIDGGRGGISGGEGSRSPSWSRRARLVASA